LGKKLGFRNRSELRAKTRLSTGLKMRFGEDLGARLRTGVGDEFRAEIGMGLGRDIAIRRLKD
jgi:hypothetical protein